MSYFETLFGFPETNPQTVYKNLRHENGQIHSKVNGKSYRAGNLEVISLADLRGHALPLPSTRGIKIDQIVADVGRLHRQPDNNGALFQAASQFNLLEMVSPEVSPRAGITGYAHDRTQGPVCAIACAAGTVHRNYFAPVGDQIGQCGPAQIDCLAEIGKHFDNDRLGLWEMRNGYALFKERGLKAVDSHLAQLNDVEIDTLRALLSIGLQWRTEVTSVGQQQIVSQAYCSGIPVGYHSFLNSPDWERLCRVVLDATYEATLLAAVENARLTGNKRCFLTLVGGGVFANRLPWIYAAIERAVKLVAGADLHVSVVSYGSRNAMVEELVNGLNE